MKPSETFGEGFWLRGPPRPGTRILLLSGLALVGSPNLAGCLAPRTGTAFPIRLPEGPTVVYLVPDLSDPFWLRVALVARRLAEQEGLSCQIHDGQNEAQRQLGDVRRWTHCGGVLLLLAPVDQATLKAALSAAQASGTPVLVLGCQVEKRENVAVLRPDYGAEGRAAAQFLADALARRNDTTSPVVYLQKPRPVGAEAERWLSFSETMQSQRRAVLGPRPVPAVRAQARMAVGKILAERPDAAAFFAEDYEIALGIYEALTAQAPPGRLVVACGPQARLLASVQAGWLTAAVMPDADQFGQQSLALALAALRGETVDPETIIPVRLVTRQTVEEWLKPPWRQ